MLEDLEDKDLSPIREIELENGNKLLLKRTDPYGFMYFNLEKGQLPEFMKGAFTSFFEAEKALQQYLAYRQMEVDTALTSPKADKRVARN